MALPQIAIDQIPNLQTAASTFGTTMQVDPTAGSVPDIILLLAIMVYEGRKFAEVATML